MTDFPTRSCRSSVLGYHAGSPRLSHATRSGKRSQDSETSLGPKLDDEGSAIGGPFNKPLEPQAMTLHFHTKQPISSTVCRLLFSLITILQEEKSQGSELKSDTSPLAKGTDPQSTESHSSFSTSRRTRSHTSSMSSPSSTSFTVAYSWHVHCASKTPQSVAPYKGQNGW